MVKKKKKGFRTGLWLFAILFVIAAYLFINYYDKVYAPSTTITKENPYLHVQSDWSRGDLTNNLYHEGILKDTASFIWLADKKEFYTLKPGRYKLKDGMSNNELINLIRNAGNRTPVRVTFNSIRTKEDFAKRISSQIEADSTEIIAKLESGETAKQYGFTESTFFTLFIPNTYEFHWNTSAEEFIQRMAKEYKRFWTEERIAKAKKLNLSQSEISILASIVQAEQLRRPSERPKVAGLYINRMRKKMKLESDPTLIFSLGDFSIKRVLNKHKETNSAYNTYMYAGLPPGPINMPEISSIDAVLNYENHDYLFMCAKPDFSGYHNFSRTYAQHREYAKKYHQELNRRNIMQ